MDCDILQGRDKRPIEHSRYGMIIYYWKDGDLDYARLKNIEGNVFAHTLLDEESSIRKNVLYSLSCFIPIPIIEKCQEYSDYIWLYSNGRTGKAHWFFTENHGNKYFSECTFLLTELLSR